MSLDGYLQRLGFRREPRADLDTLKALHRAHITSIPYENLDIQLGRSLPLDESRFYRKLVSEGRGGWCYEMNGLLLWALDQIGFNVTRVSGAVMRETRGDSAIGNHLVGLVDLDERWVCDVGVADGPLEPFPLAEAVWREGALKFRLERLDGEWWRFHNDPRGMASNYDFTETPRRLEDFTEACQRLQTDPASRFVNNAIVVRRRDTGAEALRNDEWLQILDGEQDGGAVPDARDYRRRLDALFGRPFREDADALWQWIQGRKG